MPGESLDTWLSTFPQELGFPLLSPSRSFAHDEELYDAQYQTNPQEVRPGMGCINVLKLQECDVSGPAVEIGCGTGLLSLGLAQASPFPAFLLTDPSPVFLKISRRKLSQANIDQSRVRYGILLAEALDVLPANTFSCIALRSTLHHVWDIEKFIRDAARALKPGGCLIHQEPYAEAYVMMGLFNQCLPALCRVDGFSLTEPQRRQIELFADTMKFYSRSDANKITAEDKHVFRIDQLTATGARYGLQTFFHPNQVFDAFSENASRPTAAQGFPQAFRMYAKFCMSWGDDMMAIFDRHFAPYLQYVTECSAGNGGPVHVGVAVAKKM